VLHVLVGAACNNNCLFCMESDRRRRSVRIHGQSPDDIRAMMDAYGKTDEILFTSGEPTLQPELLTYAAWARERGFRTIALITNGRRLAYPGYVVQLLDAGINRITVSIHGHTAKLHDGLTRCPGSFAQTVAGLENLARIRKTRHVDLHTSTVITQRALPQLESIFRLLLEKGVDVIVFNVMMAKGRGAAYAPQLLPSYRAIVDAVERLCKKLGAADLLRLRVEDLPPCFVAQLPPGVCGETEEYDQFEEAGSTGLTELAVLNPASSRADVPEQSRGERRAPAEGAGPTEQQALGAVRDQVSGAELQGEDSYYLTHRSFKERLLRVKGEPCEHCSLRDTCPGVWQPYVDLYGWADFSPVVPAA
jgi:wyosine [tRNA(Phe)-imidazoG37] synthetase (radical SAM superfamily)